MKLRTLVSAFVVTVLGTGTLPASAAISPTDPTSIHREVMNAFKAGEKKIVIPPGTYRLPRPETLPWHLRFEDLKNFEIDATGVTIISEGRDRRTLMFNHCENVTLRGLTVLREIPPFSQGKITAIAEKRDTVDIRIDKGYPSDIDDTRYFPRIPVFNVYKPGTRQLKPLVPDVYISRIERQGPDTFRFHLRTPLKPHIPILVGEPVAWRGPSGADVAFWDSARMTLENVTVKNGTGLGYHEMGGEGGNVYRNVNITYAPPPAGATDQQLLACGTDGFHSVGVRRGPTLENCRFEGLNDDAINIHGFWAMVAGGDQNKVILDIRSFHSDRNGPVPFARNGDLIRLYDRNGAYSGEARLVSQRRLTDYKPDDKGWSRSRFFSDLTKADYWEYTLDKPVTSQGGGFAANTNAVGSDFVIRNCTFRDNRGRGIFIRASNGLIEGNTIERTNMAGILIAPELFAWNESDYARNVVIRNNTLRDVGVASQPWNSGITVAAFEHGKFLPLPAGHRNIVIENNRLENVRGANIVVASAIGVTVTGNQLINPMQEPAYRVETFGISNDKALFYLREASDVKVTNNTVTNPGPAFGVLWDKDETVTATGLESGITLRN